VDTSSTTRCVENPSENPVAQVGGWLNATSLVYRCSKHHIPINGQNGVKNSKNPLYRNWNGRFPRPKKKQIWGTYV
jgi:hypothetical protein